MDYKVYFRSDKGKAERLEVVFDAFLDRLSVKEIQKRLEEKFGILFSERSIGYILQDIRKRNEKEELELEQMSPLRFEERIRSEGSISLVNIKRIVKMNSEERKRTGKKGGIPLCTGLIDILNGKIT